jgi:negative regulator of replication initiation
MTQDQRQKIDELATDYLNRLYDKTEALGLTTAESVEDLYGYFARHSSHIGDCFCDTREIILQQFKDEDDFDVQEAQKLLEYNIVHYNEIDHRLVAKGHVSQIKA